MHEYWEAPHIRRWREQFPDDVVDSGESGVRQHFEGKGYEVRFGDDAEVQIRKPGREWRDVGFVDEYVTLYGKAAELERRRKLTNAIKQMRHRRQKHLLDR